MRRRILHDVRDHSLALLSAALPAVRKLFGVTFLHGAGVTAWPETLLWLRGGDASLDRGEVTLSSAYAESSPIAVAISTIAEDSAGVPWELFPKGKSKKPVESHALFDVFAEPNEYMHGLQLWIGTYVSYLLFGEAFWYYPDLLVPETPTAPENQRLASRSGTIEILDPRRVKYKLVNGSIEWTLDVKGVGLPLQITGLTLFKRYNPYDPIRGLSKVLSILIEASGDRAAAEWNRRFMSDQNGIPAGLLKPTTGVGMTKDEREEYLRLWNQKHGSKRTVGILPAGWDWVDLGVSQRDMDFRALREYSREEILGMMGVPPFIAGVLDKANYANAREQKEVYWQGTITRFITSIQWTLNKDFLPKIGMADFELYAKWEVVKAMLEDFKTMVATARELWAMGVPLEQINDRMDLGLDPKKIPGADQGFLPVGVIPVEAMLASPAGIEETDDGARPEDGGPEEGESAGARRRTLLPVVLTSDKRKDALWRATRAQIAAHEIQFQRVTRRHFHEIKQEIVSNLSGMRGWRIRHGVGAAKEVEYYLFDLDAAQRRLVSATEPIYRSAIKRGADSLVAELGMALPLPTSSPEVIAMVAQAGQRIVGVDLTVAREVSETIREGMLHGENLAELTKRVDEVMRDSLARAATIARTETAWAFTKTRFQAMQANGIRQHQWVSARDPVVRETHAPKTGVDGEIRKVGERFSNGLLYPLDSTAEDPAEVINCRCIAVPVIRPGR